MRSLGPILLLSATLTLAACGSDASTDAFAPSTPVAAQTPATTPEAAVNEAEQSSDASSPAKSSSAAAADVKQGVCSDVPAASPKTFDIPKPSGKLDTAKKNVVTMKTSCGTIELTLDPTTYPITSNEFAWLVKHKYYDGLSFTRVSPNFVIQGGDASVGTYSVPSGPEWNTVEAPKADATYPKGTLAMAKAGDAPAGTADSQFFIMSGDQGLDPSYAIAGKVTGGMDAVDAIAALTNGQDAPPTKPVVIYKATFKAS